MNVINSIEFRKAKLSDFNEMLVNERKAYPIPWSERNLKKCLQGRYINFLMTREKIVIGHMILQVVLDEIQLLNICVNPRFQGEGLGHKWMEFLTEYAKQYDVNSIILEVRASNKIAKRLYRKYDFEDIGLRKNYYPLDQNRREDALVMKAFV